MSRQTILISSLGESPAVVTEAIDKLEHEEGIQFTQVITLGTNENDVRIGAKILSEHIPTHYNKRNIVYLHQAIEATDVLSEKDNLDYLTLVAETLRA
ncbi:MAG: CRISPR-associated ring nuclease, partial [Acidobacteriota bacterium]|nr:CRISPR-associated ring nuclease [Acidobacteriota bacterium]